MTWLNRKSPAPTPPTPTQGERMLKPTPATQPMPEVKAESAPVERAQLTEELLQELLQQVEQRWDDPKFMPNPAHLAALVERARRDTSEAVLMRPHWVLGLAHVLTVYVRAIEEHKKLQGAP